MDIVAIVPNLLIGLREGLEAGLIVTLLLAATKKSSLLTTRATSPIWLGVIAAMSVSFAAGLILVFSRSSFSSIGQEILAGFLSLLSVFLVSIMILWMHKSAQQFASHLEESVVTAAKIGAGALISTAFFSVAREGLETTLFLWANAKASHTTLWPIIGALLGISLAIILCILLNRRMVHFNIGRFFRYTIPFLILLAAGVLAYAIFELQSVGLIPGYYWIAWDFSAHISTDSWWATILQGVFQLTPKMTVLQVVAWLVYVAVMFYAIFFVVRFNSHAVSSPNISEFSSKGGEEINAVSVKVSKKQRLKTLPMYGLYEKCVETIRLWLYERPKTFGTLLIVIPLLCAVIVIGIIPQTESANELIDVAVTDHSCAPGITSHLAGALHFMVASQATKAMEVNLVNASDDLVAEIETLGPHTSAPMDAVLNPGGYKFLCLIPGLAQPLSSNSFSLDPHGTLITAPPGVKELRVSDLEPIARQYAHYAKPAVKAVLSETEKLNSAIQSANYPLAKKIWFLAQSDWEKVGAAYDSFGELADAVDGLAWGLPHGVHDRNFTGLHRIEYGIWRNESPTILMPIVQKTIQSEQTILAKIDSLTIDPVNMPLRGHEILEDALRDHITGLSDYGSHQGYALTLADISATEKVLGMLTPLLNEREPHLVPTIQQQLTILRDDLVRALTMGPVAEPGAVYYGASDISPHNYALAYAKNPEIMWKLRQKINGDLSYVLELLSALPTVLEVPLDR